MTTLDTPNPCLPLKLEAMSILSEVYKTGSTELDGQFMCDLAQASSDANLNNFIDRLESSLPIILQSNKHRVEVDKLTKLGMILTEVQSKLDEGGNSVVDKQSAFGERSENPVILFLVRHGSTALNEADKLRGWLDVELSDKGRQQAKEIGERFKDIEISHLYCSDLKRTRQTAQAISNCTGVPVQPTANLRPINFGDLQGQEVSKISGQLDAITEGWMIDPSIPAPGGESFVDFQTRNLEFLRQVLAESKPGDRICIAAHLRNCVYFLAVAANGLDELIGDEIDLMNHIAQDPGNVSTLEYDTDKKQLQVVEQNTIPKATKDNNKTPGPTNVS